MNAKEVKSIVSANVDRLRKQHGYSARELGRLAGIDEKQVRRILDPEYEYGATLTVLSKLAEVLHCPVDYLFETSTSEGRAVYWPTLLIADGHNKPIKITMTEPCMFYDEAVQLLNKTKEKYDTLTAWIDKYDPRDVSSRTTVFHACYI